MVFRDSVYVALHLSLYRNLSPSTFFLNSRAGSYASMFSDSAGDVLKASVDILIPFLYVLLRFF